MLPADGWWNHFSAQEIDTKTVNFRATIVQLKNTTYTPIECTNECYCMRVEKLTALNHINFLQITTLQITFVLLCILWFGALVVVSGGFISFSFAFVCSMFCQNFSTIQCFHYFCWHCMQHSLVNISFTYVLPHMIHMFIFSVSDSIMQYNFLYKYWAI